ncbi:hypothetical protein N9193_01445 [Pseudomonadales bacterium]|nr:hypothetical protein [Pseudomonadales bacterium]
MFQMGFNLVRLAKTEKNQLTWNLSILFILVSMSVVVLASSIGFMGIKNYIQTVSGEETFFQKDDYGANFREKRIKYINSQHPWIGLIGSSFLLLICIVAFICGLRLIWDRVGANKYLLIINDSYIKNRHVSVFWDDVERIETQQSLKVIYLYTEKGKFEFISTLYARLDFATLEAEVSRRIARSRKKNET